MPATVTEKLELLRRPLPPRLRPYSWLLVLLLAGLALPAYGDDYVTSVGVTIATYSVLGVGLTIVLGYAGLIDLGYAAFFAIGAYSTAILTTQFHLNFWATIPVAMVATGITGALLGYPVLRLRNDYLAIVTLGFGEMVRIAFNNWDYVGGPDGVWDIPPPSLFGQTLSSETDSWIIVIGLLALALTLARNLADSRLGRGWLAMREDEFAAEAVGVPTLQMKILAYALGGVWGGVAGSFFATRIGIVTPDSFTFTVSVTVLIIIGIGGLGNLGGVLLGASLMLGLPEVLRTADKYRLLFFAVALVALMILRPQGLWPANRRIRATADAEPATDGSQAVNLAATSPGPSAAPILEASDVSRSFGGVLAVNSVSLQIRVGEILSVIGPNGAGKTTLFNCLTGVTKPSKGAIQFKGQQIAGRAPHLIARLGMARTFQGIRLFPGLTAVENVMVGKYPSKRAPIWQCILHTPHERALERATVHEATSWLEFVGCGRFRDQLPTELSYADQRRLELARALMAHPELVLLDEPAAGMNPTEKRGLIELIHRIRALGTSVVVVDHDMSVIMNVSDRIIVLDLGAVIAEGTPSEVQQNVRVIDAYLGRDDDLELVDSEARRVAQ